MKTIILLFCLLNFFVKTSYSGDLDFLIGTWKVDSSDNYEHWDKLNDNTFKGCSYSLIKDGTFSILEYLQISTLNNKTTYSANVLTQNEGQEIQFTMSKKDNSFIFENSKHDFPNQIVYNKLSENEIFVKVSGQKQQSGYSYKMTRTNVLDSSSQNPKYNKILADELGSDDYGMKSYFLVILKTGSNTNADKTFIGECFRGHLENINKLVSEKIMIVAGPLGKNPNTYRGIFILQNMKSIKEVEEVLDTDPAIKNKLLDYEIYNWYGSAALPEYLPFSDKIWKLKP